MEPAGTATIEISADMSALRLLGLAAESATLASTDADELMAVGIHRLAGEQTYDLLDRATYVRIAACALALADRAT